MRNLGAKKHEHDEIGVNSVDTTCNTIKFKVKKLNH